MSNKKADRFAEGVNAEQDDSSEETKLGKVFTVRAGSTQVDATGRYTGGDPHSSSPSGSTDKGSHDRKKTVKNDKKKRKYDLRNTTSTKKTKNLNLNSTERSAGIQGKKKIPEIIPNNGFHLATDLRLDSALILKLLSLEEADHATSDDEIKFYSFV
jgi:hypothetical protein